MKIKNGTVFTLENSVDANGMGLLQRLASTRMMAGQAYNRNVSIKSIEEQFKDITKIRDDLIKKYGKESEDGNFSISPDDQENMQKFMDEFNEVLEIEEDLKIRKISIDALNDMELNFYELETLGFMIDFPVEESEAVEAEVVD